MNIVNFLLGLSMILLCAKLFGELALHIGQSEIIGELFAGIVLGPCMFNVIHETPILLMMAEIGSIILLFDVGLSINIKNFIKSSKLAFLVAISGILIPYLFVYIVFTSFHFTKFQAAFAAAILTATSIAVTARILKDSNKLETQEAEIVLGAAFIDDILGIFILTIVLKIISGKSITTYSVIQILIRIIIFFISAILFSVILPLVYKLIAKMKQEYSLLIVTICICFMIATIAVKAELATIVGAFIFGIMLTRTHTIKQIKQDIKPLYSFFVPIFFVLMGSNIKLNIFNPFIMDNAKFMIITLVIFIASFLGKLLSGFIILRKGVDKLIIGLSMVPRGEVGLIFARIGLQHNIFETNYYSVLVTVIMLLTLITPIILKYLLGKRNLTTI
ncbi:MAG: cation:proton antiporter [Endomicrobium sp.]|jgi:Kef-type K+ transport system membrane component KefB|nr:cation:proton antiporter [Endomicrobium sp.]